MRLCEVVSIEKPSMFKSKISKLLASITLVFSGVGGFLLSKAENKTQEVSATTYDRDQATYYTAEFSHKVTSSQYGNTLLSTLHELMYDSHKFYNSYDDLFTYTKETDYDIDNPDNIVLLYSRQLVHGEKNTEVWNREHVWCQSHAFFSTSTGAGSDLHHLRPASTNYNSSRSNTPYGIVSNHLESYRMGDTDCFSNDGKFEPADYIKGDVARVLMYVYTHYASAVGGTSSYSGALNITDIVNTSAGTTQAAWDLLMDWNESDPVDYQEMIRNNKASYYLGNLNPFIDHPEFARMIWDDSSSQQAGLFFTTSYKTVNVGSSYTNIASKYGYVSSSGDITYTSDNPSIATVNSNGQVTGVSNGVARIKARATINGVSKISYHFVVVGSGYSPKYTLRASGVVYTPTSKTTAVASETLASETVSYSNSYGQSQLTSGKSLTLTISNFPKTISSFKLYMKSNGSSGKGSITVTVGGSSYYSKSGTFASIYGSYSTSFVPVNITNASASKKTGTIVVTISCSENSLYFQKAVIDYSERTVTQATSINVTPSSISLTPGEDNVLTTSFTPPNTTLQTCTWSSSNTSIATVNKYGLVRAIAVGTATITATAGDGSGATGSATINVVNEVTPEPSGTVTGVTVSPSSTSLDVYNNASTTLSATVNGTGSPSQSVTWTVSSASPSGCATVNSSGTVTALAQGSAVIRATSVQNSTYYGECTVTISDSTPALSSITIDTAPTKTTYTEGEYFDPTGLVIERHFANNTTSTYTYANHESSFSFSPDLDEALTTSDTSVSITYGGKSVSQSITVSENSSYTEVLVSNSNSTYYQSGYVTGVEGNSNNALWTGAHISGEQKKNNGSNAINITYAEIRVYASHSFTITPRNGYSIDSIVITANDSTYASAVGGSSISNCTKSVSGSTVTLTPTDGESAVTFTNSAQSRINKISVEYSTSSSTPTLSSISLDTTSVKKSFTVGEAFTYSGLVVTANYSDSSTSTVASGYTVSTPDMSSAGEKEVTVSYGGKTAKYTITVSAQASSITASVSKTYYVGESISASDITVEDNLGNEINDFSFANDGYSFTYADAASGGSLTDKTFTNAITYSTFTCSLTVQVQRKARITPSSVTDEITATGLGVSGNSYSSYTDKTFTSDAVYSAQCMKDSSDNIQMRTTGSNSGVVTTSSGGTIQSVTINVGSGTKTVQVYAKNTAYSSPSDLFSNDSATQGTLIDSTSSTKAITFTGSYTYFGVRSSSGAIYLSSIEVTYGDSDSAINLSNYVMYEDTNGQCTTKFATAKGYFEDLTKEERASFMTSNGYVVSTARTRLQAWAAYLGKTITYTNGDYVISSSNVLNPIVLKDSNKVMIITVISLISVSAIGGYFFLRKRKEM